MKIDVWSGTRKVLPGLLCILLLMFFFASLSMSAEAPARPSVPEKPGAVKSALPPASDMDALTAIFTRRSIRKYTSQPVSDEAIGIILRAAMSAPSARNEQSWEFVVIREKKTLQQVPSFHPFARHVPDAPVAIVVCGNTKLEAKPGLWALDCSNATMNILLSAHSMGLGAVWTTLYPYEDRMAGIKKLLNLPDHIIPLTIIPIGHPGEKKPREDRFNASKIHHERW
jgi:nitroreductase